MPQIRLRMIMGRTMGHHHPRRQDLHECMVCRSFPDFSAVIKLLRCRVTTLAADRVSSTSWSDPMRSVFAFSVLAISLLSTISAQAERRTFIIANNADGYGVDRCLARGDKCGAAM